MAINHSAIIAALRRINAAACVLIPLAEAHQAAKHKTGGVETDMSAADKQAMLTACQTTDAELQAAITAYNSVKP